MGIYRVRTLLVLAVSLCVLWMNINSAHGRPEQKGGVALKKVLKPCVDQVQPALQKESNHSEPVVSTPCDPGDVPPVKGVPEKLPVTLATKLDTITDDYSNESSFTEKSLKHEQKEDLSGGTTGLNSDEVLRSELEEEVEAVDSLAPRAPHPEKDAGADSSVTTEATLRKPGQDIATNKHIPDEKKSELFIDSGIFPFIAMGVLSALFITMMIAALYFARHSSDIQHHHRQISMKPLGLGPVGLPTSRNSGSAFHTVTFRNAQDGVIGDFAVNMFAVHQDAREEASRELTNMSESTLLATPSDTAVSKAAPEPATHEAVRSTTTLLHRDLPDVVSTPSSRRETMSNNRHSTGSSLYMELINMCRNTRLIEELALRRKNIRMQDASQPENDEMFSSDTDSKSGKLVVRRQVSLDSGRCRNTVPLPSTYESHYFKLYDGDDDDSSALASASASANTTMDAVPFSSDEGCSSTLNSLHRKGSSKRNSRLLDESRQLLPVQEFFNEAMMDSSDGGDVLYETIDEMGYRRRTASSQAIRRLMEARESAGHAGETIVVENAWESSPKKYDKIDRSITAYKKHIAVDKDYNTLMV
ncbi:uncharacterized protein LOC110987781 [Acanthaster planci]|uniref:Uncharacterized protein LOC110987781 n=1 Tax=Acanthaster planci TaxID=133434 RepID=A0A8B7ZSV6_ACAPL|nr:uncharacterized protein LOC110987781 [Acanthaster planci]